MGAARTLFYHEDPIFYMLPLLIPDELKSTLDPDAQTTLESALHKAIKGASLVNWRYAEFDWKKARINVELVLREYQTPLPLRAAPVAQNSVQGGRNVEQTSLGATPLLMALA
jgi:hypothetical protein